MPSEMSMRVAAFVLSVFGVLVGLFPFSRFRRAPRWMRVTVILLGASGALGSAATVFGIAGSASGVLADVALALAVAAVAYFIWAKKAKA